MRGEASGSIAGFQNIADGKAGAGDIFDVVAEQGLVAVGGATGAAGGWEAIKSNGNVLRRGKGNINRKKPKTKTKNRCKRSTEDFSVIDYKLNELPANVSRALPGQIRDLGNVQWDNLDQSINAIFSIFLIIKLFLIGHPRSESYFEEVCDHVYPSMELQVNFVCPANKWSMLLKLFTMSLHRKDCKNAFVFN